MRKTSLTLLLVYGQFVCAEPMQQLNEAATNSTVSYAPQKTAVGYYRNKNNNLLPFTYNTINSGATWALDNIMPLPTNVAVNGIQNTTLRSVSCDSTGHLCRTIGFYLTSRNNLVPLSYTSVNSGTNWSLSATLPLPANNASSGVQNARLHSIACASSGLACSSVGYYLNSSSNLVPLSYTTANGGASWSLSNPLPLPTNVAATGIQNNRLLGMTCDSTGKLCTAVGFYLNLNNNIAPISYTSINGGTVWSLSKMLPLPTDAATNGAQNSVLQNVACANTGNICSAVGYYLNTNNNVLPLSYTSTNGGATWRLSNQLPLPKNVAANGIQNSKLSGITCDTTGLICTTVGFYLNTNNNIAPLSYTTANGGITWSLSSKHSLPGDINAGIQNSVLQSVSCNSLGKSCTAVGFYLNNNNNTVPLAYISVNSGKTWSLGPKFSLPADVSANGSQSSVLFSVS